MVFAKFLDKRVLVEIAGTVGIPAAVLGIAGRLLDKKFGTSPWILLAALFIALHLTLAIFIYRFRSLLASLSNPKPKAQMTNQAQNPND